jgi:lipid-A-disaccharide synthase
MSDAVHRMRAREQLGLVGEGPVVAVLPGSRASEVKLMGPGFLEACEHIRAAEPGIRFVVPCLRPIIRLRMEEMLHAYPGIEVTLYDGNARLALTACDAALVKSGTSTLEAMLLHRPMVVSYRLGELTYQLVSRLLRTPYVALPNILAGERLVPELLQHDATPQALAQNLRVELYRATSDGEYLSRFEVLHDTLRKRADERAAQAVMDWLGRRA